MQRTTHNIDATDKVLGRLATEVANLLRGKGKVEFEYHLDIGDSVEISNVNKIKLTGNKLNQKLYRRHSGYPGGLKEEKMSKLMQERPHKVFRDAVYNMLPKNKLRDKMIKRLTFKK